MASNHTDAATGLLSVVAGGFVAFFKILFSSPLTEAIVYGTIGGFFGMFGRWIFMRIFESKKFGNKKNIAKTNKSKK